MCQLSLYCLVPRDENVSYSLYRGSKLISEIRNFTHLVNKTEARSLLTYTCNVSNKVSWESDTLNITQGCQSAPQSKWGHFGSQQGLHNQTHMRPSIRSHGLLVQCLGPFLSRHWASQKHRSVLAWEDLYLSLLLETVA